MLLNTRKGHVYRAGPRRNQESRYAALHRSNRDSRNLRKKPELSRIKASLDNESISLPGGAIVSESFAKRMSVTVTRPYIAAIKIPCI